MQITLSFPDRRLSPNARVYWRSKIEYAKIAREEAFVLAREAAQDAEPMTGNLRLRLCFHPPDNRRRDQDNLLASMKAQLDSVCRALGVDDSQIRETVITWGEPVPGGQVVMVVEEM